MLQRIKSRFTPLSVWVAVFGLIGFATAASGVIRDAAIVLKQGDVLGTSAVSALNTPWTDGNGNVGFVGSLADAQRFIWWNNGPVFFSGNALPLVLTGSESTMGVDNNGGFVYSPAVDGEDAVFTQVGTLLRAGDPLPPLPGLYSSFNSRPTMLPDGTAYWIGGSATTPTGSSSNRHLFRADPADPGGMTRVLGGGDIIEGKMIKTTASNFDYWISDNGAHHIHVLDMNVTLNEHVYLDGVFVAQEGSPTGQGDNWSTFDVVGVNNDGHYIFTGDTDGLTATDEFLAYDGLIAVREGDVLDGVTIASGATFRAAAINDLNQVAHLWGVTTAEWLFFGEGADLAGSSLLLAVADSIDVDGDETADYIVTDFNAAASVGPGLDLSENGLVYVDVDVRPLDSATSVAAILRLTVGPVSAVAAAGSNPRVVLLPGVPNPFRVQTSIHYVLPQDSPVRLTVHDILGRQVRVLYHGPRVAGEHTQSWDGRDASGRRVAAGAYFVRLQARDSSQPQRVVLLD